MKKSIKQGFTQHKAVLGEKMENLLVKQNY